MSSIKHIETLNAPLPVGTYSQAVQAGNLLFISGQIPIDPHTSKMVEGDFAAEAKQVFDNLKAIAIAADSHLGNTVKLTVYLRDINQFSKINEVMENYFATPYPARVLIEVSRLPKDATVEVDAILAL